VRGVPNVPMAEPVLQEPGVGAVVRQDVPTGVPEHVRVHRPEASSVAGLLHQVVGVLPGRAGALTRSRLTFLTPVARLLTFRPLAAVASVVLGSWKNKSGCPPYGWLPMATELPARPHRHPPGLGSSVCWNLSRVLAPRESCAAKKGPVQPH
jgi:hypothetical protein